MKAKVGADSSMNAGRKSAKVGEAEMLDTSAASNRNEQPVRRVPTLADPQFTSPAFDAVLAASHPLPENGGPCATCAFRPGTQANQSEHTTMLAKLCVEGISPFDCHEKKQLCRGWIAAVNLRGAPVTEDDHHWVEASRLAIEVLNDAIDAGVEADRKAGIFPPANTEAVGP